MNDFSILIKNRIEALRPKLQDTSRRNPLINNVLGAKSSAFIRIVDEKPQNIYNDIVNSENKNMDLVPLPPTDIDPPDEDSSEFINAFISSQSTDEEYIHKIEIIDFEHDLNAIDKQQDAERGLKDRIRAMLDMPPRPTTEQFSDLNNHAKAHGINPSSSLPQADEVADDDRFDDDRLQTLLLPKTFQSRMLRIHSKMKMYKEERGLDVVYLAIGYLKWTLPNAEKQGDFKSPLLLIPVSLSKSKSKEGEIYSVTKLSDPIFNPSLEHKLTSEAKIDISSIKDLVGSEDIDVEGLFDSIAAMEPKNMMWNVMREATFGIYPFQGIELYNDLDTQDCDFSQFPIVSELMLGKQESEEYLNEFDEGDVESKKGMQLVPHLVLDADSSQFIALLKIANNENLALEGPPGSGKSQTIVNAIANSIHSGKRVLFVAQKSTALEVVYSRLQALSLEKFVLPLMGGHGDTDDFYEAVSKRLSLTKKSSSKDIANLRQQYELQKDKLTKYIDLIKKPVRGTGMTVHQVLGLSIANASAINELPLELKTAKFFPEKYSPSFLPRDIENISSRIKNWQRNLSEVKAQPDSVWLGVNPTLVDTDKINEALITAKSSLVELEIAINELGRESKVQVETYLENNYASIKYDIEEAAIDKGLKEAHLLVQKIGEELATTTLLKLVDLNLEIEKIPQQLNLTETALHNLLNQPRNLNNLLEFSTQNNIQRVETGISHQAKNTLEKRQLAIESALSYKDFFSGLLGVEVSAQNLVALKPITGNANELKSFKELLNQKGIEGAKNDAREARRLYRIATQIFNEPALPEVERLKRLDNIIKNGGFFSFLSSNVRNAKNEAKLMLSGLVEKSTKIEILSALNEALDLTKKWKTLEISDYVNKFDHHTDDQFSNFLIQLETLQDIHNTTGLNEKLILKLIFSDSLQEAIECIETTETEDITWSSLRALQEKNTEVLDYFLDKFDSIIEAEEFLVEIGNQRVSEIPLLIEAAVRTKELLGKKEEFSDIIDLNSENSSKILNLLEAVKDYSSMTMTSKEILFNEEWKNVLNLVATKKDLVRVIHESTLALFESKGIYDIDPNALGITEEVALMNAHMSDQAGLNNLITQKRIISESRSLGFDDLLIKLHRYEDSDSAHKAASAAIVYSLKNQVERDYGARLLEFDGASLSDARSQLQKLDKRLIELSRLEVSTNAISYASPPQGVSYGKKSEFTDLALLDHELQKKRRTPPRKLLKRAQGALLELFPCWMMVPTAVAQFLSRAALFDLVIIDEASQMSPENSISALIRGKNALIAGDTNQLPPTNFFKGLSSDDDEDEDIATTEESILELANVQFHPKHRLLWHYRSKHEELIAFSNHYVYDSELVIFPSPNPSVEHLGISLIQVNGTYQRGINPAEAQVMAEAIAQFMEETPDRSLGVAVMNQSQMEQIESLILRESQTNKCVSDYIDKWATEKEGLEKFFVKNLENVQGDERDVIFVGTVYGRDAQGKFYQQFGPVNGTAGKRRLNVLFSRAKEQMVTFSSIPMSDFNPNPSNEGSTLLRRWLEFSATKKLGEIANPNDRAGYTDSPFEDHVIEAISSLGYEAIPQIGVSSYFIDIGVKHPSYPFGYICGVECDGASYHSSKSARDRDRLREEVLERLGWNLYRIWSTDWFRDSLGCRSLMKQYLDERLASLLENMPEWTDTRSTAEPLLPDEPETAPSGLGYFPSSETEVNVQFGSRVTVRYLDGPRAGATAKFWYQKTKETTLQLEGFITLGLDTPLGEAIESAGIDEIRTYEHGASEVRVQILDIENP